MKLRLCLFTTALATLTAGSARAQVTGPSTRTSPYVVPSREGVSTVSILTVGDQIDGYRMVGIPDGVGAWRPDDDDRDGHDRDGHDRDGHDRDGHDRGPCGADHDEAFELVVDHELARTAGVVRSHGATGAFVSRWRIDGETFEVVSGRDHLARPQSLHTWNGTSHVAGAGALERLCSADLASPSAYAYRHLGARERIYLSGEETTPPFTADHGRLFAHVLTGRERDQSWELPWLGRMAFENALASPYPQPRTVVVLSDDANRNTGLPANLVCRALGQTGCEEAPSELFVYVGDKRARGTAIERAGLTGGALYGVRVVRPDGTRVLGEQVANVLGSVGELTAARFELVALGDDGDVSRWSGVQLEDDAIEQQITQFIRVEDGAWDPRRGREDDYYFVTTGRITTSAATWRPSRLWRLRFDDVTRPERGGTLTMLLTSRFDADNVNDPGFQMLDNLTIDRLGRVVLQEDVGNNARLGRIWLYDLDRGRAPLLVAAHDARYFAGDAATNPTFLTRDEESSGIVDAADTLGLGWFLLTSQSHAASPDAELVEGGQLLAMYIAPWLR